ncbi:hypothetical protein HOK00_04705 [bacterium]|jgi:hypothetical protein|nr:hypothetical protein [bacterium]
MLDFIFFFFLIFGYKIGVIDFSILISGSILLSLVIIKKVNLIRIPKIISIFMAIFSLIIIVACVSFLINNGDFIPEFVLKPVRVIILMFIIYFYIKIRKLSFINILKILLFVILVHSIVIYLQYILYYLGIDKTFLYHPSLTWTSPFRKVGLTTGFPVAGLIVVFGSMLSLFLYYLSRNRIYIFIFFIMSLSIFITARSAMFIYILLIPTYMFILSYSYRRYSLIVWYLLFILSSVLIVYFYLIETIPMMQGTIDKMFANIINYMETGSFHDYSTAHLVSSDHLYFPDTAKTFLIGNSLGKESGFQPSDIGYVRITMGIGVFGIILYLIAYLVMYSLSIKRANRLNYPTSKILLSLIYIAFFIMSLKSDYMFSRVIGDSITILSFAYLFSVEENNLLIKKEVV